MPLSNHTNPAKSVQKLGPSRRGKRVKTGGVLFISGRGPIQPKGGLFGDHQPVGFGRRDQKHPPGLLLQRLTGCHVVANGLAVAGLVQRRCLPAFKTTVNAYSSYGGLRSAY